MTSKFSRQPGRHKTPAICKSPKILLVPPIIPPPGCYCQISPNEEALPPGTDTDCLLQASQVGLEDGSDVGVSVEVTSGSWDGPSVIPAGGAGEMGTYTAGDEPGMVTITATFTYPDTHQCVDACQVEVIAE